MSKCRCKAEITWDALLKPDVVRSGTLDIIYCQLHAAAPELLKVLRTLVDDMESRGIQKLPSGRDSPAYHWARREIKNVAQG